MIPWNIVVAAFEGARTEAPDFRQRLLDTWCGHAAINVSALTAESLKPEHLRMIEGVVLIVGATDDPVRVLPQLSTIEEAGVACLVLIDDSAGPVATHRYASHMLEHISTDAAVLCAKLEGLLHRQPEVHQLREDVQLAQRFHGGLKGEIAKIHDELQLAAMVQREFLPRELPNLFGVDFAALWRPAHYVSGDIYDIVRLDDDHIGVFIADAVGHGVPAALMTMVICRSLTTKVISGSSYHLVEPRDVLGQLNEDMIRRQGRTTRFATGVYAVVNCRERTMRLAGAGHPPPLLYHADGTCTELVTDGGLLGVFPDEVYGQIDVELAAGDRLMLYSDGFEQAFPESAQNEYERRIPTDRYRRVFDTLVSCDGPAEMIGRLGAMVDDEQGSLHQADDLTMLCMRAGALVADECAPAARAA